MNRLILTLLTLVFLTLACATPAWAPMPLLTPTHNATETALPTPKSSPNALVTASLSLNVRVRPGEQARVVGYLYTGNTVTLTNVCSSGWAQIQWRGGTAWVNAKYLSDNKCKE
jgi:uncharacterized protein YgiM (DUF1202 family)